MSSREPISKTFGFINIRTIGATLEVELTKPGTTLNLLTELQVNR